VTAPVIAKLLRSSSLRQMSCILAV
jgi:hypothetical protein